ncbi:MAG: 30S ribosomal protein S18 [Chloroflexi bacterium]|nr:30S ribosomal protein S18 [Chloroflexota bacterium]
MARNDARSGPPRRRRDGRKFFPRRKVCSFCVDHIKEIDFKDVTRLRRHVTEWAKIEPRRRSGVCAPHQRDLARALRRARYMALLPFTGDHSLMDLSRQDGGFRRDRDGGRFRRDRDAGPRYGAPAARPPEGAEAPSTPAASTDETTAVAVASPETATEESAVVAVAAPEADAPVAEVVSEAEAPVESPSAEAADVAPVAEEVPPAEPESVTEEPAAAAEPEVDESTTTA